MNGLGKPFRKKTDNRKTVKIIVKMQDVNKKPLARKQISVQTPVFSLNYKIRAKKFHASKPLSFSLHFLFLRDQNHQPNKVGRTANKR